MVFLQICGLAKLWNQEKSAVWNCSNGQFFRGDKVWYMFKVVDKHGTQVTKDTAFKENPKITVISWPNPWWNQNVKDS